MKIFDFKKAKELGQNIKKLKWLKENMNKPITEAEFVRAMQEIKLFRNGKSYKYSPSNLKYSFAKLKKNFGFFK